jgi:phosphopantetheine adenylyltransferase
VRHDHAGTDHLLLGHRNNLTWDVGSGVQLQIDSDDNLAQVDMAEIHPYQIQRDLLGRPIQTQ